MKSSERGLRRVRRDGVELFPAQARHAAIVIRLNLESRRSEGKRWELRDWPWRQQRYHHPLASNVKTGDAGRSGEKNVRERGQFRFAQYNFVLGKIGDF